MLGPWFLGYLTEDQFGAIFLWGIVIDRSYLPPDAQVYLGNFQFFFLILPFTYTLSSTCFYRFERIQSTRQGKYRSFLNRCRHIYRIYVLFIFTMILMIFVSIGITVSYRLSWLISPFSFPLITFFIVLYIKAHRLQRGNFRLQLSHEEENSNFIPN